MTATEKYLKMNHCFIELRDAIFESDVDEADEPEDAEKSIMYALVWNAGQHLPAIATII